MSNGQKGLTKQTYNKQTMYVTNEVQQLSCGRNEWDCDGRMDSAAKQQTKSNMSAM